MKKLLYFASDFKIGLSALLTDQLISITDAGVDVVPIAGETEQECGLTKILDDKGIKLIRIKGLDIHTNFWGLVKQIKDIVVSQNIDIIHVQNNWQLAIAGVVKTKLRLKHKIELAYTLHGFRHNSPIKSHIAQAVIGSALFLFADHVICMTEYLRRKFNLLSYKIRLIPLGVKDDFFCTEFQTPRTDGLHLIFPAQFRKGKNQDIIIRAFANYIKQSSDTTSTLTLPGSGQLLNDIQSLATEMGISDRVFFPGQQSKNQIKQLYLNSNIAIVASNSETFGQSIVEPYVLGRCIISTKVGIAPEIIKDGENGYIFNNETDLTKIFTKLAEKPSDIIEMGKTNFKERNRFTWDNITNLYINTILKQ